MRTSIIEFLAFIKSITQSLIGTLHLLFNSCFQLGVCFQLGLPRDYGQALRRIYSVLGVV
jgi:hypothetical protein